jgi:hypothetical protein
VGPGERVDEEFDDQDMSNVLFYFISLIAGLTYKQHCETQGVGKVYKKGWKLNKATDNVVM